MDGKRQQLLLEKGKLIDEQVALNISEKTQTQCQYRDKSSVNKIEVFLTILFILIVLFLINVSQGVLRWVFIMTTFLLVHGSWHGGWCYKKVVQKLTQQGHDVYTPTLTGLGERSHLLSREVNLSTHIEDVCNVIRFEELKDVVLCGHSYAGMVITGVADRMPEHIKTLVYLDAFIPENGKSALDYCNVFWRQKILSGAAANQGCFVPPVSARDLGIVDAKDCEWVDRHCTVMPLAPFVEAISLTGDFEKVPNLIYVYAEKREGSTFFQFFNRIKNDQHWIATAVPCGHDMMIDMPDRLAEILTSPL